MFGVWGLEFRVQCFLGFRATLVHGIHRCARTLQTLIGWVTGHRIGSYFGLNRGQKEGLGTEPHWPGALRV